MSDTPVLAMPPLPPTWLPFWKAAMVGRRNALSVWPQEAFGMDLVERKVLRRHVFIVNAPDLIRHVLIGNATNYGRSALLARVLQPAIGLGLLLSEGAEWRRQRHAVAPAYAPPRAPVLARVVRTHTDRMLQRWAELPDGTERDVSRDIAGITLGVGAEVIFSEAKAGDLDTIAEAVLTYDVRVRPTLGDMMGLPGWLSRPRFNRHDELIAGGEAPMVRMIAERMRRGGGNDILAAICAPRDDGQPPTAQSIRDQAITLVLAGHVTMHASMLWALYLLARHPQERARLEAEIDTVLEGRPPEHEDVARLPFTRMVLEETMRLYPPIYVIPRLAVGPDRIGGHDVPKGANIVISPWLLHRNPKLWEQPSRFIPERFNEANSAARQRFSYIPFGAGQRICVGAPFAMVQTILILASIIQSWQLDLPQGATVEPVGLVTLRPRNGMTLRFQRRPRAAA